MMKSVIAGNNGAIYEHIAADELRLELERTREELHATKKQLTDRDSELLQLKTAHRKLQDALRKKDKDLQNVFAVLRAPQDAELTKKRKTELVERLLTETQQRVVNAEAVAEERKRELDKFKFSSKFLRYQEMEVEIEECHAEIERLQVELSRYAVVGKLKVSRAPLDASQKTKTPAKPIVRRSSGNQHSESVGMRDQQVAPVLERTVQTVKPLPLQPAHKRESFVDKTRKAVELEYSKQLRLAELEAECELEENLRIRAKREAQAQAEARRRKSQQDAMKSRKTVAVSSAPVPKENPTVQAYIEAKDLNQPSAAPASSSEIAIESIVAEDEPKESGAATHKANDGIVAEPSPDEISAVAAVVEAVVNAVEHEPPVEVVAPPVAQEPKHYEEEDFDDGPEADHDDDDDESDSVVEEASTARDTEKPAGPHSEEKAEEEVSDDDEVGDSTTESKPQPVAHNPRESIMREEVYDEDEKPEQASTTGSDEQRETPTATKAEYRQGFVVSVDPQEEEEESYQPMEPEHKQGFVVEPTYDTEAVAEPAAESAETDPASGRIAENPVQEDSEIVAEEATKANEPTEQHTSVAVEESGFKEEEEPTHHTASAASSESTEESRELPEAQPAAIAAEEEIHEPTPAELPPISTDQKDPSRINSSNEPSVAQRELEETPTPSSPTESPHRVVEETVADPSHSSSIAGDPGHEQDEKEIPTTGVSEDAAAEKPAPVHTEPAADETAVTVAQTLHDCDDAIDAATSVIHHQIDDALAEASALTEASSTHAETLSTASNAELTASELKAAMDSAARKIQRFWREMERKYTPSATAGTPATATPRSGHSGTSTPLESAESPVSETDGW